MRKTWICSRPSFYGNLTVRCKSNTKYRESNPLPPPLPKTLSGCPPFVTKGHPGEWASYILREGFGVRGRGLCYGRIRYQDLALQVEQISYARRRSCPPRESQTFPCLLLTCICVRVLHRPSCIPPTSAPRVTNRRSVTYTEPQNFYFESLECGRRCLLTGVLGGRVGRGGVPCQSVEQNRDSETRWIKDKQS